MFTENTAFYLLNTNQLISFKKMLIIDCEVNTKRLKFESSCVFKQVVYIVTTVCLKSLRVIKRHLNKHISRLVTIAYISSYTCILGVVVVVVALFCFIFFEYCFT